MQIASQNKHIQNIFSHSKALFADPIKLLQMYFTIAKRLQAEFHINYDVINTILKRINSIMNN